MAKITLNSFLTLDGVMQAPGGPNEDPDGNFTHGGWVVPHFAPDMGAIMLDIFSRAGAFLLGRGTYDIFYAHWPNVKDPTDLIANRLNTLPKYVASNSQSSFDWNNTTHLGDVLANVGSIRDQVEGELQVHGSHGLARTLIENRLIDEFRLFVFPVAIGTGKRLFDSLSSPVSFELLGTRILSTGVTYNVYRPAGEFRTGSFGV